MSESLLEANTMEEKLKHFDQAYANSLLAQAVYMDKQWALNEIGSNIYNMGPHFKKAIENKQEMNTFKLWNYLKSNVSLVPANEVNLSATSEDKVFISRNKDYFFDTKFTYKNGQYSAGRKNEDIARAALVTSEDPANPGKKILHVVFRGTEFSRIREYGTKAYLDMDAYYYHFKPLEDMVRQYVNNPAHNISEIHATGHSLGGSMAEQFLKNMPDNPEAGYIVKGFTFGSPGATKKGMTAFMGAAYHSVKNFFAIKENHPVSEIYNTYEQKKNSECVSNLGQCLLPEKTKDPRLTHYYHSNDPVPIVGVAGYKKNGEKVNLNDRLELMSRQVGIIKSSFLEKIPVISTMYKFFTSKRFHDSDRYSINLRDSIENILHENNLSKEKVAELAPNWRQWTKSEIEFQRFGVKYKPLIESVLLEKNPYMTKEELITAVYDIRDSMKNDNNAIILANKIGMQNKGKHHLVAEEKSEAEYKSVLHGSFGSAASMTTKDAMQERLEKIRRTVVAENAEEARRFKLG